MATQDKLSVYYQRRAIYEQKLAAYQAALIKYRADLEIWNSLSADEQAEQHANAEKESRERWSILLGICIAGILYLVLKKPLHGIWFWISWSILSLTVVCLGVWQSRWVGLVARGMGYAVGSLVVALFIELAISSKSPHLMTNKYVIVVNVVIPILGYLIGMFTRATGEPKAPSPPSAPARPA